MTLRLRIRTLMILVAMVASFVGIFAPELRAWNRDTLVILSFMGVVTAVALASFTPVWISCCSGCTIVSTRERRSGSSILP